MATFSELVQQETQNPIVLLEIDQKRDQNSWMSYEPGLWQMALTLFGEIDWAPFFEKPDPYNRTIRHVGSFFVGLTEYTEVSTFANLRSQNESYIWDQDSQTLYVHFTDFDPWYVFVDDGIKVGISLPYCSTANVNGYTSDAGIFYEPRVKTLPMIKYEKDDLFFGTIQNTSANFSLTNGDDDNIDDLIDQTLFGNNVRVLMGYDELATDDFKQLFTGRVDNVPTFGQLIINFTLKDERAFLTKRIGTQLYSNTDTTADYYYPNLSDDNSGLPVQLAFGKCRKVLAINLDENQSGPPTNYTYKVAATDLPNSTHFDISAITAAYVDGIEKTIVSTDLVNGTFEIAGTDVKDGDSFMEVTADVEGYEESSTLIENPLRFLEIILDVYDDTEFIAANYDLTEWNDSKSKVPDMGLYNNERIRIGDVIEKIVSSTYNTSSNEAGGLYIILGDGRITYRLRDNDTASEKTIDFNEEDPNAIDAMYDPTEQLSTAECKYDRSWNAGRFRTVTDESRENTVLANTGTNRNKAFKTLIVNKTDAQAYAEAVMNESFEIRPTFETTTFLQNLELELAKNIDAKINRINKTWFGTVKCEIIKHEIDLNNWRINMTLRYIEDVEE